MRKLLSKNTILASTLTAALAFICTVPANATVPEWNPKSSEKLVKLPSNYLKKTLTNDFAQSALGVALQGTIDQIGAKKATLKDFQAAIKEASGDVKIELKHQFLVEKRAYLDLMQKRIDQQEKRLKIHMRLSEEMFKSLSNEKALLTPARQELVERQNEARARFEGAISDVDLHLFQDSPQPQSKYSVKYSQNAFAIQKLMVKLESHKMNAQQNSESAKTKEEYLRQMTADAQSELSLLKQEQQIIGYMAKFVAMDALALAEETGGLDETIVATGADINIAGDVDLFVTD